MPKKPEEVRTSPAAKQVLSDLRTREREVPDILTKSIEANKRKEGRGMKVSDAFPSAYLTAADLGGKTVRVTIKGYRMFQFEDQDKEKLILSFSDHDKELVTNVTNANMITEVLGTDEMDDWTGKTISLKSQKVQFGSKMTDAIRVQYPSDE